MCIFYNIILSFKNQKGKKLKQIPHDLNAQYKTKQPLHTQKKKQLHNTPAKKESRRTSQLKTDIYML